MLTKRDLPWVVFLGASILLVLILFTIFSKIFSPTISVFIPLTITITMTIFFILPLFVKSSYDKKVDKEESWALSEEDRLRRVEPQYPTKSFRGAFTLSKSDLKEIYELLVAHMSLNKAELDTHFYIKYKRVPDQQRTLEDLHRLQDVLDIKNCGDMEIRDLKIVILRNLHPQANPVPAVQAQANPVPAVQAQANQQIGSISLQFMREDYTSIRYYIDGGHVSLRKSLNEKLDDMIAIRIKQFSSFRVGFWILLALLWILIEGDIFLYFIIQTLNFPKWFILEAPIGFALAIISMITCMYYFPRYNFCWGYYSFLLEKRHKIGSFIVNNLFTIIFGILIGLLAGLLANYYTPLIIGGHP